jgi:ribonuclease P protein component
VYDHGARLSGPCFAAFYWRNPQATDGPKLGFTAPRALGKATKRNRMKRRVREALRLRLPEIGPAWSIVINLRRGALDAPVEVVRQEVTRLVQRCAA